MYLPSPSKPKFVDAVGSVTVSTPLFSPFDSPPDSANRLDFGDAKSESEIAARINTPNLAIEAIRYQAIESSLRATIAGESVSSTATSTTVLNDVFMREQKLSEERRFETPDSAPSSAQLGTPNAVQTALESLLKRSGSEFQLPPDQVATLVAAHKVFMVNLEEYYNASGYEFDGAHEAGWIPYKAHFTVTAEPGYFTRHNQYDAVVDLRFGLEHGHDQLRILTVTPLETAQTLNQLSAELTTLKTELEASGTSGPAAVAASLRTIDQLARRLEGLRTNKTLVVGYPKPNVCRIRFRPSIVATEEEQDLQPTSRVLTAMVLVRSSPTDGGTTGLAVGSSIDRPEAASPVAQTLEKLNEKITEARVSLSEARSVLQAFDGADPMVTPEKLVAKIAAAERGLAGAQDSKFNKYASRTYRPVDIEFEQRGYFAPGLRDRSGEFSPARAYPGFGDAWFSWFLDKPTYRLWAEEDGVDEYNPKALHQPGVGQYGGKGIRPWPLRLRSDRSKQVHFKAPIPIWRGEFGRELQITKARGFFAFDSATPLGLSLDTARLQKDLDKAKKALEPKSKAVNEAKKELDEKVAQLKTAEKTLEAAIKELKAAQNANDSARITIATKALNDAKTKKSKAETAKSSADSAYSKAKDEAKEPQRVAKVAQKEFDDHIKALRLAWTVAAKNASVSVGVRARAPIGYLALDGRARAARVFARFTPDAMTTGSAWVMLGKGDLGATFTVSGVDLSNAIQVTKDGNLRLAQLGGFVELALVDVVDNPSFNGEPGTILKRAVQDIVVEPAAKFVPTPQPKKDEEKKEDKPKAPSGGSKALEIKVDDIELKLTGSAAGSGAAPAASTSTTPAATSTNK